MITYKEKLQIVTEHFQNGDYNLGYRKLIDCVLDTKNLSIYQEAIDLTDWKETHVPSKDILHQKVSLFISKLEKIEVESDKHPTLLEATNIVKKYGRGNFQLGEVSLKVKQGDVWGLVGENGNGKTTLLRILAKDLKYDSGEIKYSLDESDLSEYELRTKLTYIPQRTPKWYGSLKSNLKFAASHYGINGEENELMVNMMIIRFGLWSYRNHNWDELSSGYKMRFELARTFLRAPQILLLDEPLANLDVVAQQVILEDLKNLSLSISNPIGIILSSQQLFEVEKVSDKVMFLKNGKPTKLSDTNTEEGLCFMELDVNCTRDELNNAIGHKKKKKIDYNGGLYLITIDEENGFNNLLTALIKNQIDIKYVRNISQSTKRLFI
ncbi:MAG: ABC transporter ATP-binding protein [Flavobacteriia bacterium]|nr:ABC transporter ATP-binding protein [Flavobacteriia bacterium]